jgi:hypothetical protein
VKEHHVGRSVLLVIGPPIVFVAVVFAIASSKGFGPGGRMDEQATHASNCPSAYALRYLPLRHSTDTLSPPPAASFGSHQSEPRRRHQ